MSRSEKLILVRDVPGAIVQALDAILVGQGYARMAAQTISEDFSPILNEPGGPLVFVLSAPHDDWVACFTSLSPEAEAELAGDLSRALQQPVVYALFAPEQDLYVYRYWEAGDLREEALPDASVSEQLDEHGLQERLARHAIPLTLLDDREAGFGEEHIVSHVTQETLHGGYSLSRACVRASEGQGGDGGYRPVPPRKWT